MPMRRKSRRQKVEESDDEFKLSDSDLKDELEYSDYVP